MRNFRVHLRAFGRDNTSLHANSLSNLERSRKVRQTLPFFSFSFAFAKILSKVFIVKAPPFFTVTLRFLTASIRFPLPVLNLSFTCAFTSFSLAIFGSWMNAPPRVFGGWSPVVAYLRHSMMVVLPLPLCPTITVTGEKNSMTEICLSSKERMPRIASLFNVAIADRVRMYDAVQEEEGVNLMRCDYVTCVEDVFSHKRVESQSRRYPSIFIMSTIDVPDVLRLADHPTARNAAVATRNLPIGSVVLAEPVLISVLFPDETGRRCDYCHRNNQTEPELRIRKCTGCEVQSYCGERCTQDPRHRRISKH